VGLARNLIVLGIHRFRYDYPRRVVPLARRGIGPERLSAVCDTRKPLRIPYPLCLLRTEVLYTRGRSLRYRKAVGKGQAFANRAVSYRLLVLVDR
jgi:hypothetical protein